MSDMVREKEIRGKPALNPGPLLQIVSISLQSNTDQPFTIYGDINVEFSDYVYGGVIGHDIYKRDRTSPELLHNGGSLSLNGPSRTCLPDHAQLPMFGSRINVNLFDGNDDIFACKSFCLDDVNIEGVHEQVCSQCIDCEKGFLIVTYIAIPLAVYCRIDVLFCNKKDSPKRDFINVNGKITARYANSYGNYNLEESILFQKQVDEYENVEIDQVKMNLSRYWVSLPAYSTLVLGVDLSEYETGQKIVSNIVEFEPQPGLMFGDSLVLDDLFINLRVSWFSPSPLRTLKESDIWRPSPNPEAIPTETMEEMDTEGDDEYSSDDDESNIPWKGLRPHKSKPSPYPAVEIFSVFISRDESNEIQVFGSIDVLSGDNKICIFKTDEKDPLHLSKDLNFIPISDGSRVYDEFDSLEMNLNLTNVGGNLNVKGYIEYDAEFLDNSYYHDKQLCSFIQGENGFAAIHYSIFLKAVVAYVSVSAVFKMERANICPSVYGCLSSEYRFFDYSSSYNRDHYRSLLFKKTRGDPARLSIDGSIPLSRSSIVVPSYSSLVINVDLSSGISSQSLSEIVEMEIGEGRKVIETDDCILCIEVDWCEIK